jgi:hypothetical protein
MCPECIASAALMISSVMSTGGLTAMVLKVRAKKDAKKSVQNPDPGTYPNPKEEIWEK